MSKYTKKQRDEHLAQVEVALQQGALTLQMAGALARRFGCSQTQVYNYRKQVIKRWTKALQDEDPVETAAEIREKLRAGQRLALQGVKNPDGEYVVQPNLQALNRLARTEAEVMQLIGPMAIEHRIVGHDGGPIRVEVQGIVAQIAAQLPSLEPEQLAAFAGMEVPRGKIIEHGDNGGNGGGRPLIHGPAEPDGDPGDDGGNGEGGPPSTEGSGPGGDSTA